MPSTYGLVCMSTLTSDLRVCLRSARGHPGGISMTLFLKVSFLKVFLARPLLLAARQVHALFTYCTFLSAAARASHWSRSPSLGTLPSRGCWSSWSTGICALRPCPWFQAQGTVWGSQYGADCGPVRLWGGGHWTGLLQGALRSIYVGGTGQSPSCSR